MTLSLIPSDADGKPVLALQDDAIGGVPVPIHIKAKVVGADGNTYAQIDTGISGGGGGGADTQYADGTSAPANPTGNAIVFNNGGTLNAVSNAHPFPITGSISATNPSVGTDGSAIPTSSTLVGGSDGTNLQPLQVDGSKNLKVVVQNSTALGQTTMAASSPVVIASNQSAVPVSGTVTANAGTGNFTVVQTTGTSLHAVLDSTSTTAVTQATGSNLHTVVDSGGLTATTNADTAIGGTTAPSKELLVAGKTNDATAQYQPIPEGAGGRSVIVEGVSGGTAVPVSGTITANAGTGNFTVTQATGSNLHSVLDSGSTTAVTQATAASLNATATIQATTGTSLAADVSNTELRTSVYGKSTVAGDTALNVDASGRIILAPNQTVEIVDSAGTNKLAVDASGRLTMVPNSSVNNAQWNGATPGVTNPVITEDQIRAWIAAGQGYSATTGKLASATNANVVTGFSVFNNSTAKNALIYSIQMTCAGAAVQQVYATTSDPAFATSITTVNNKAGGAAGSITSTSTVNGATTSITPSGTSLFAPGCAAFANVEVLQGGSCLLLPSGAANGIAVYITVPTAAQVYGVSVKWIEY